MEEFDKDEKLNKFLNQLKLKSESTKPDENLLHKTLYKISVTNDEVVRTNNWKVVNNTSISLYIMSKLKILVPVGALAILALVIVFAVGKANPAKSNLSMTPDPKTNNENAMVAPKPGNTVANSTQPKSSTNPKDSIDAITSGTDYSEDSTISADTSDSTDASQVDQDIADAYSEQYENN